MANIPSTRMSPIKEGKRRKIVGAILLVLGHVLVVVAFGVAPGIEEFDTVLQDRSNYLMGIGIVVWVVGSGILLWGVIDGVRAFRRETQLH